MPEWLRGFCAVKPRVLPGLAIVAAAASKRELGVAKERPPNFVVNLNIVVLLFQSV